LTQVGMSVRTIAIEEASLPIKMFPEWERAGGEFPDFWKKKLSDFDGQRLEEMDRCGIELAILSSTVPGPQGEPNPELAEAMARDANDALAAVVAKRPDRFAAFATLSMHNVEAACREFERAVRELGMCGVLLNNFQVAGPYRQDAIYYDGREFDPFWDLAEQLGVPVYLHALRLITTGVFDRYPGAQLILGHNGEHIVYDMWRVTTSGQFSDHGLRHAINEIGAHRIMFAIDYPYEENEAGTSWFASTPITDGERAAIGRENAIKLFNLADRLRPAAR